VYLTNGAAAFTSREAWQAETTKAGSTHKERRKELCSGN
jgi:hypothetical protein